MVTAEYLQRRSALLVWERREDAVTSPIGELCVMAANPEQWPKDYDGNSGDLDRISEAWQERIRKDESCFQQEDITDVVGIARNGMKVQLQLLDTSQQPNIVGVLYPATKQFFLDWTLLRGAPTSFGLQSTFAWRKSVDASPGARFLLAWAIVHLSCENDYRPYTYGFLPTRTSPNLHTVQRRLATMRRVAQLLCPRPRLYAQTQALVRSYPNGQERQPGWLISALAEMNKCPSCIVEMALDGPLHMPKWTELTTSLLSELPMLNLRHRQIASMFAPLPNTFGAQHANPHDIVQLWL